MAAFRKGDYASSIRHLRPLAEQGNADASGFLGYLHLSGQGVPQDYVLAHMWFNLASAQGDEDAVETRDAVADQMTPDQIAEAQRLARAWWAAH